jgi:hypothetical protein
MHSKRAILLLVVNPCNTIAIQFIRLYGVITGQIVYFMLTVMLTSHLQAQFESAGRATARWHRLALNLRENRVTTRDVLMTKRRI